MDSFNPCGNIHLSVKDFYSENSGNLTCKEIIDEENLVQHGNIQAIISSPLFPPDVLKENITEVTSSRSKRKKNDNCSGNELIEKKKRINKERERVRRATKKQEWSDIEKEASFLNALANRCCILFPDIEPKPEISSSIEGKQENEKISMKTVLENLTRCKNVFSNFIHHVDLLKKESQVKIQQLEQFDEDAKKHENLEYWNSLVEYQELFQ